MKYYENILNVKSGTYKSLLAWHMCFIDTQEDAHRSHGR